jgi:hypothetical protein
VEDINVDAPEGMSYAEWEASNAMHQVKIPRWLEAFLRIPGGFIILLLILFPLTLVRSGSTASTAPGGGPAGA